MTTTLGRLGRRVRNQIMRPTKVSNQPRRPLATAPFSSALCKVFTVVPPVVVKIVVRASFIGHASNRLLFAILENLKIRRGQISNHNAVYNVFLKLNIPLADR